MGRRASAAILSAIFFVLIALAISVLVGMFFTQPTSLFCLKWGGDDVVPACWRPQNVTLIAVLWVIATLVGIVDTIRTLTEASEEREVAKSDPVLAAIATSNVRRELFRLLELVALLVVGSIAVTGTTATVVSRLFVLFVVVMLVLNSMLDRRERQATDRLLRSTHKINGGQ